MGMGVTDLGQCAGEAWALAQKHARLALEFKGKRPHIFISGGETTVKVTGTGQGGRNTEYAFHLAESLSGAPGIYGLAIDTDGKDGTGPFAGAMFGPEILTSVENMRNYNKNNDSGEFFNLKDGLINTSPTLTNLNDLRMILLV
jgi:hydroxypyruvate reductase